MAVMTLLGTPREYAEFIYDEATEQGVDPVTIIAIAHTETGGTYNPRARNSSSGALGLMQIAPFWRRHFHMTRRQLMNPMINLETGIKIYATLKERLPRRCRAYYTRYQCERVVTPLHFYRCNIRSALSRNCRRSVRSVNSIKRRIVSELEDLQNGQ